MTTRVINKGMTDRIENIAQISNIKFSSDKKPVQWCAAGELTATDKTFEACIYDGYQGIAGQVNEIFKNKPEEIKVNLAGKRLSDVWNASCKAVWNNRCVAISDHEYFSYLERSDSGNPLVLYGAACEDIPANEFHGFIPKGEKVPHMPYVEKNGQQILCYPYAALDLYLSDLKRLCYFQMKLNDVFDIANLQYQLNFLDNLAGILPNRWLSSLGLRLRRSRQIVSFYIDSPENIIYEVRNVLGIFFTEETEEMLFDLIVNSKDEITIDMERGSSNRLMGTNTLHLFENEYYRLLETDEEKKESQRLITDYLQHNA